MTNSRSKRLFFGFAVIFMTALFLASYDIAQRTTFPGSKPQLKERIKKQLNEAPNSGTDTLKVKKK